MGVLRISGLDRRAHEGGEGRRVRVCTVNVGTVVGRSGELVEMLARRRVEICCLQEVRYKGKGCRVLKHGDDQYKLWWSGNPNGVGGVWEF